MTEMTDEELAVKCAERSDTLTQRGKLLGLAYERLYALSAHVALLKASLAQAEREAEGAKQNVVDDHETVVEQGNSVNLGTENSHVVDVAAASEEPFGYFRALPFGWEACSETDEGAIALYEHPAPAASSEPEAWAKENGAVTFDAFRASCWKSNADKVVALYSAPQPARVAELTAEVERLRAALSRLLTSDPTGAIANAADDELRFAVNDERADPVVREQAASILQARAALAGKEAQS